MQCYKFHYFNIFILILLAIIAQVLSNHASRSHVHHSSKRQVNDYRNFNSELQSRRSENHAGTTRYGLQPLSLSENPSVAGPARPQRQASGLNLGLGNLLNLGLGGNSPNMAYQPVQPMKPLLSLGLGSMQGMNLGGMPSVMGSSAQNAATHGFPAAQNPANGGGLVQNPRPQTHPQNEHYENEPARRPQGSGSNSNNNNNHQQNNGRPNHNSGGGSGNNGEEYNPQIGGGGNGGGNSNSQGNRENHGNQGNRENQGNQGGSGKKKCRGNQYTCQNRECVQRNARCNGINECQDGSDENNCSNASDNRFGGQDPSVDRTTTAAPTVTTTAASTNEGCILPEQPIGGSFELGSCRSPCNVAAGTRVPLSSFLTYRCDRGYTLNGNNVSFCHGGTWYSPPTCLKVCPPLRSNSVDIVCKLHGETVSCESTIAPGTKATLACKNSYKIPLTEDPAYRELNCLEDGVWDRTLFRCLPECGTAVSHGNTLIVNGFTAKLGVFPWHVGIYEKNGAGDFQQICAGTLVSPDLVVSAAHCFYDDSINEVQDASKYAVAAGKHYRSYNMPEKYAQKSLVRKIEVAPRYLGAGGNFAQDISMVRLATALTLTTLVRPICMDWENTYEREQLQNGQSGKAVGWGKTAEGVPSTELQEINLPFVDHRRCVDDVPEEFRGYVTADKFCAGYLNGSSLCEGDSGGGLCFQLNGLWYLRGIVSVSPVAENTCDNNYYTAFTNVGGFVEWIRAAYITTV